MSGDLVRLIVRTDGCANQSGPQSGEDILTGQICSCASLLNDLVESSPPAHGIRPDARARYCRQGWASRTAGVLVVHDFHPVQPRLHGVGRVARISRNGRGRAATVVLNRAVRVLAHELLGAP